MLLCLAETTSIEGVPSSLPVKTPSSSLRIPAVAAAADVGETWDAPLVSAPPSLPTRRGEQRVGQRVGAWLLEALLGEGGMGAVYRARDADGRTVALKVLCEERTSSAGARFLDEVTALRAVSHENVVQVFDAVDDGAQRYYTMEYVHGVPLSEAFGSDREGGQTAARFLQIARALAAMHAAGVIHRDLKPANIIVSLGDAGAVKLVDFGVATNARGGFSADDRTNAIVGTPAYMAPEQLVGQPVTEAIDVYAFGLLLYEALVGEPPFHATTFGELVLRHVSVPPPCASSACELARPFDALIAACLEKVPAQRPTMAAVVVMLETLAAR